MKDTRDEIQELKNNVAYIADALQLMLPKSNHHDCRLHCIEMSANEEGDLFLNMDNFFHKKIKIQVKYCPICGFEGNEPPEFKLATIPRSGDGPR